MDLLRQVMNRNVITIDHDKTARDAARLMADHSIGSLVIARDGKPVGIVTERDLVRKVCTKDLASSKISLSEIMSKPLIWAEPDLEIETAVQRMLNSKIRRLPVMENGDLVGIVTITDMAKHLRTKSLIGKIFK